MPLLLATRFWPLTARCSLTDHREPAAQPSLQRAPTAASPAAEQGGVTAPVAQEGRKRRLSLLSTLCSNQLRKYVVKLDLLTAAGARVSIRLSLCLGYVVISGVLLALGLETPVTSRELRPL